MSVIATTRPDYRDTRKPTAVCVYTIAQESRHLIIENIPGFGSIEEFIQHCSQFGQVAGYTMLDTHASSDSNTDVVWIQYGTIGEARYAKRKMDDKPYQYNLLRVNYAPEYESAQDIRDKFQDRFQVVHSRLNKLGSGKKRSRQQQQQGQQKRIEEEKSHVYGPIERQYQAINNTARTINSIEDDNEILITATHAGDIATTTTASNKKKRRRI